MITISNLKELPLVIYPRTFSNGEPVKTIVAAAGKHETYFYVSPTLGIKYLFFTTSPQSRAEQERT